MESTEGLKLYIVEWETSSSGFDNVNRFIVCCKTEQEARETHPRDAECPEAKFIFYDKEKACWWTTTSEGNRRYMDTKYYLNGWVPGNQIDNLKVTLLSETSCHAAGVVMIQT